MSAHGEPSYLAFSRVNVREGLSSSPTLVRLLLDRIDRDAKRLAELEATK